MPDTIDGLACPKCGNLVHCTCTLEERHQEGCRFVRAAGMVKGMIAKLFCIHGYKACPICDACDCEPKRVEAGIR